MLPYLQWEQFHIGSLTIQVWGLFVGLGILLGLWVAMTIAKKRSLDTNAVLDIGFWVVVSSLLGGRIVYVVSEFQFYASHVVDALKVWDGGMSISGGFIGAFLSAWFLMRKKQLPFLEYADVIIFGLPVGLWIGRLGCFFIFDHPGVETTFFLGQEYVDGLVRHNHGLYLSLNGLVLTIVFWILWHRKPDRTPGFFVTIFLVWYGIMRFSIDFFRANTGLVADARFAHLTVAQYVAIGMVAAGGFLWYRIFYTTTQKSTKTDGTSKKEKTSK